MVCRCMCRSVVDENEERTEQVFVHQVRRRGGAFVQVVVVPDRVSSEAQTPSRNGWVYFPFSAIRRFARDKHKAIAPSIP